MHLWVMRGWLFSCIPLKRPKVFRGVRNNDRTPELELLKFGEEGMSEEERW